MSGESKEWMDGNESLNRPLAWATSSRELDMIGDCGVGETADEEDGTLRGLSLGGGGG